MIPREDCEKVVTVLHWAAAAHMENSWAFFSLSVEMGASNAVRHQFAVNRYRSIVAERHVPTNHEVQTKYEDRDSMAWTNGADRGTFDNPFFHENHCIIFL